jgi:FkbM family methyltransferase
METSDFLRLSRGKSGLIDIGAQTGFISAVFARSRSKAHILSFEPDPQVFGILQRARERNLSSGIEWEIRSQAVSNSGGLITISTSNTLYESPTGGEAFGKRIDVPAVTLHKIVEELEWRPDILKIDVESFEYEILLSSLPLLVERKPAIQLEVHWDLLKNRSLNALDFLKPLYEYGYRGNRSRYRGLQEWVNASKREHVSRLSLEVCLD